jgi:hypothetical protein
MALFDWNGDGCLDMFDDAMEYQLLQEIMGKTDPAESDDEDDDELHGFCEQYSKR